MGSRPKPAQSFDGIEFTSEPPDQEGYWWVKDQIGGINVAYLLRLKDGDLSGWVPSVPAAVFCSRGRWPKGVKYTPVVLFEASACQCSRPAARKRYHQIGQG